MKTAAKTKPRKGAITIKGVTNARLSQLLAGSALVLFGQPVPVSEYHIVNQQYNVRSGAWNVTVRTTAVDPGIEHAPVEEG